MGIDKLITDLDQYHIHLDGNIYRFNRDTLDVASCKSLSELSKLVETNLNEKLRQNDELTTDVIFEMEPIREVIKIVENLGATPIRCKQFIKDLILRKKAKKKPLLLIIDGTSKIPQLLSKITLSRQLFPDMDVMFFNSDSDEPINGSNFSKFEFAGFDQYDQREKQIRTMGDYYFKIGLPMLNRFFTKINPKLYIITAPSGYGKSTLLNQLKLQNVKTLKMLTTRVPRSKAEFDAGEKEFVGKSEFDYLAKHDKLVGVVKCSDSYYGFRGEDIEAISLGRKHYAVPMGDYPTIVELKKAFPDLIRIIHLNPTIDFAGFGLERRLEELSEPGFGFNSFQEELAYIRHTQHSIIDTRKRLEMSMKDCGEAEKYRHHFDYEITSTNMNQIVEEALQYIYGELQK